TLSPPASGKGPTSYSFHNNRDGTFTDVTAKSGLTHTGWGQGCCIGDYDNDGYDDLFVTYFGRNVLYHNNGDGTFTDVSEKAGVAGTGDRWGAGCCFLDYDRDGHLAWFVRNSFSSNAKKRPNPGEPITGATNKFPFPGAPKVLPGALKFLNRIRGDGTFLDVSEPSGIARPRGSASM